MRVNILTQPLFCNYGGILQNYALQHVLRGLGHEPLTVNTPAPRPGRRVLWKDTLKAGRNLLRRLQGRYPYPFLSPYRFACKEHELSGAQRAFVARHIATAQEPAPYPADVDRRHPADAWVVGSDQVWRPWCSPNLPNAFLDFLGDDTATRRIAYAASLGTDVWEIDDATTARLRPLAARFTALSVRDQSAVALCREHLGVTPTHVLDPTLLLDADTYGALLADSDRPAPGYVASYILDVDARKAASVRSLARRHGLRVQRVGRMQRHGFDSVESWIAGIAGAERVVTDSFHGTVFALIFRRPVLVHTNPLRGNTRIESLMAALQLRPDDDGFVRLTDDGALQQLRRRSLLFLSNALS